MPPQARVFAASWQGVPVAVKVFREALPQGVLGRRGSCNVDTMLARLEGSATPPSARSEADARTLSLLRELSTFIHCAHPNLVRLYGWYVAADSGAVCLVMERLEGSLAQVARSSALEPVAAVRGVAEALRYLHGRGLLHRDVKPENVMVDGRGVKLADFGLVRALGTAPAVTAQPELTPRNAIVVTAAAPPVGPPTSITGMMRRSSSMGDAAAPPPTAATLAPSRVAPVGRRLTPLIFGPPAEPQAPVEQRLRRQMTAQCGSLVTMAPEVWQSREGYGTAADVYSLGRLIAYMKALSWRWRGVAVLDQLEKECTAEEPGARPTAAQVCDALAQAQRAEAAAVERRRHRWGCLARVLPSTPASLALLPARIGQSLSYGVLRATVMRPSWYLTQLGVGGQQGPQG